MICLSTGEIHNSKTAIFLAHAKRNEKKMSDICHDGIPGLLKHQINFPLFKVSEPSKFQMSEFCIKPKKGIFSLIPNRMEIIQMSHILLFYTTVY